MDKKLYLSDTDKKISGVCGGIAEYANMDSTIVRLVWVAITAASGFVPGIVAYFLAAIVIPKKPVEGKREDREEV